MTITATERHARGASAVGDDLEGSVGEALTLTTNHFQIGGSKTMARIFITGSANCLGRMAAELLIEQDHRVVLTLEARPVQRRQRETFRKWRPW
jgi:hypothetical protein